MPPVITRSIHRRKQFCLLITAVSGVWINIGELLRKPWSCKKLFYSENGRIAGWRIKMTALRYLLVRRPASSNLIIWPDRKTARHHPAGHKKFPDRDDCPLNVAVLVEEPYSCLPARVLRVHWVLPDEVNKGNRPWKLCFNRVGVPLGPDMLMNVSATVRGTWNWIARKKRQFESYSVIADVLL